MNPEMQNTVLTLLSVNLIVPLTDYIRQRWISPSLSFVSWALMAGLSTLAAWLIAPADFISLAMVIITGSGAIHANNKMKVKKNGGA